MENQSVWSYHRHRYGDGTRATQRQGEPEGEG